MVEAKVEVKAVVVAGLLVVEEEGKEVVVAGLLEEVEEVGHQEEVEDGQVEVVAVVVDGMRVEQLKIGGERYRLNFISAYPY